MQITDCGGCGGCMDFICPVGAFKFIGTSANIDVDKCTDCGKCKIEIECLCEAIK